MGRQPKMPMLDQDMKRSEAILKIAEEFDLEEEALDFIHLFTSGKATVDSIRGDVLMDSDQEETAVRAYGPLYQQEIRKLMRRRERTWKAICYAMNWNHTGENNDQRGSA